MSKKSLPGLSGNRIGYIEPGDNEWSEIINKSLQTIARQLDLYKSGVADISGNLGESLNLRIGELKESIATIVSEYSTLIESQKEIIEPNLRAYVDLRFDQAIQTFQTRIKTETTNTLLTKDNLTKQVKFVESVFNTLRQEFLKNNERFIDKIRERVASRDTTKQLIMTRLETSEAALDAHIQDLNNPHKVRGAQLAKRGTVYQSDPDNYTGMLDPLRAAREIQAILDNVATTSGTGSQISELLNSTLGLGDYRNALILGNGKFGNHYYLSFAAIGDTLVDSEGDTGTWEYFEGGLLQILWDIGSGKATQKWKLLIGSSFPKDFSRLTNIDLIRFGALNNNIIDQAAGFILYHNSVPIPDLFASILGIGSGRLHVDGATDPDLNWSIDIQGTPAAWGGAGNSGNLYYFEPRLIEPAEPLKLRKTGPFVSGTRWIDEPTENLEDGSPFLINLAPFPTHAFDANRIHIRADFDPVLTKVNFLYNMFERVLLPAVASSSSSMVDDGDYQAITTESYTVEVEWSFPSGPILQNGDVINVTTKRRSNITGSDIAGTNTSGTFTVELSDRYNGV